jgi:hypothetical protein
VAENPPDIGDLSEDPISARQARSLCGAQVTIDEVPPRRGGQPVQERAIHRLAPRTAVAQGDAVWFDLEGLRQDGDFPGIPLAPCDIPQGGRVAQNGLHLAG